MRRLRYYQKPFFQELWKLGIKFYLILPNSDCKWYPYSLYLDGTKIQNLIKFDGHSVDLDDIGILNPSDLSKTNQKTGCSKIHPIIKEIMKDMIKIPAGSFMMGDPEIPEERPVHKVTISKPYYIAKYMVTQELWKKVMGKLPYLESSKSSPRFPITYINYDNMIEFVQTLNSLPGGGGFDLPTDAQWEYACRAGSTGSYCFGNDENLLDQYAWSKNNAKGKIHDVGLLKPNNWGLYDMHGLEFEMVKDGYRKYTSQPVIDPVGPLNDQNGVSRGGHWGRYPFPPKKKDHYFRCGVRYYPTPKNDISYRLSFRLVRNIS
jgi:formylglycine-generating enzyme required for sulfatase activity